MGAGLEEQRRRIESIYNGLSKIAKEELELIQAGGFSLNHIQNRIASFKMTITNYNLMLINECSEDERGLCALIDIVQKRMYSQRN